MDIVVVSRHVEIPDRFRRHVEEKLAKVEQLAPSAQRIDVEITHERNPRQADKAERVELTVRDRGPVVRAEASASDRYAALDAATTKLLERLRRARDRRKTHHPRHEPVTAVDAPVAEIAAEAVAELASPHAGPTENGVPIESTLGDSPVVIRQKVHATVPMSVDEALYEMELVGHPFYLFIDGENGQPCVVYHRHGWSYGVIRLDASIPRPEVEPAG
jgi:ribosomal subunit interface protein